MAGKAIADTVKAQMHETIRTSSTPWGTPWKPHKVRKGGKPLLDTGELKSSNVTFRVVPTVQEGTNQLKGWTHQYGMNLGKRKVPARSFLPITVKSGGDRPSARVNVTSMPEKWVEEIQAVIAEAINNSKN